MVRIAVVMTGLLGLTACGPVSLETAEQQCYEQARLAQAPRGSVGIFADSNGNFGSNVTIGISSDYLRGRDPDQVFQSCVFNKSGQNPSRPFSMLPQSRY